MADHTPGPWWTFKAGWITSARGTICAMCAMRSGSYEDDKEGLANTALIAAAPELLEALKATAAEYCQHVCLGLHDPLEGSEFHPHFQQCRDNYAAIAKAEGRT